MLPCPVSGEIGIDYWISQWYGGNKAKYAHYGMDGHNGIDIAVPVGTPLYAPFDGYFTYGDEGRIGYGKYVQIISDPMGASQNRRRVDLGHLSRFIAGIKDGQFVYAGDLIGMSGTTGDSTGPHLHITYKKLRMNGDTLDMQNGYKGAIDVYQWMYEWDINRVLKK